MHLKQYSGVVVYDLRVFILKMRGVYLVHYFAHLNFKYLYLGISYNS